MGDVLELSTFRRRRRLKKQLETTKKVLEITKIYYTQIQPFFTYKLMYDIGKEMLEFRKHLVYNIKEITKELRINNEK